MITFILMTKAKDGFVGNAGHGNSTHPVALTCVVFFMQEKWNKLNLQCILHVLFLPYPIICGG